MRACLTLPATHQNVRAMRTLLVLAVSVTALAGCGLRGPLERPVPLWGNPPSEGPNDPRVIKAAKEAADAEKARKEAEQKAEDEARRQRLEQQATPPATAPAATSPAQQ